MISKTHLDKMQIALNVFTPRQAIRKADQLAGRKTEVNKVMSAIFQPGAHAIIYGERGVGKTSLSNCVAETMAMASSDPAAMPLILPSVNCDSGDSYSAVWHKVFGGIQVSQSADGVGYIPTALQLTTSADVEMPADITPFNVLQSLSRYAGSRGITVMLDEFDRLPDGEVTRLMADTVKSLSDQNVKSTIVIIGVGESVMALIRGHESIARHLIEVPVPRMTRPEQKEVLQNRVPEIGLTISDATCDLIASISRGLPFYLHLLGQKAAISAINADASEITGDHVGSSMTLAIAESETALRDNYYQATRNPQPTNKYPHTIAACALAACDDFGYFAPKNVAPVLSKIIGKQREAGSFTDRLNKLTESDRGCVLVASGKKYDKRYRFRDPLMQPFVVMKSLAENIITLDDLTA